MEYQGKISRFFKTPDVGVEREEAYGVALEEKASSLTMGGAGRVAESPNGPKLLPWPPM